MNRKVFLYVSVLILLSAAAGAQNTDTMLNAYMKSFARGSLSTKIQVLQDSAKIAGSDMCPLYLQASRFVADNYRTLYDDSAAGELTLLTVRLAGLKGCSGTSEILWNLFNESDNLQLRTEIISSLGSMDLSGSSISSLNKWLREENDKKRNGKSVDEQLVMEMVTALGKLGDPSSFSVLFSTGALQYSVEISSKAVAALKKLGTDYTKAIIEIAEKGHLEDRLAVLKLAVSDHDMQDGSKGKILQALLEESIKDSPEDGGSYSDKDKQALRNLRLEAAKALTSLHWTAAGNLALKNFDITLQEIENGLVTNTRLVEAVNFLGSVKTHEAAVRLSAYLEVLNSRKESGQPVNTKVITAVIENLNYIGDKTAFDNLLYAGYLDYPSSVKQAAREALNNLKTP